MKLLTFIYLVTLFLSTGCSSSDTKAKELLETARFEEKQSNRSHAISLYSEIVRDYPASSAAKAAVDRLKFLSQPAR